MPVGRGWRRKKKAQYWFLGSQCSGFCVVYARTRVAFTRSTGRSMRLVLGHVLSFDVSGVSAHVAMYQKQQLTKRICRVLSKGKRD